MATYSRVWKVREPLRTLLAAREPLRTLLAVREPLRTLLAAFKIKYGCWKGGGGANPFPQAIHFFVSKISCTEGWSSNTVSCGVPVQDPWSLNVFI